jgi:leader peptidase (prepilin peptidase)/N-methyltransferase
MELTGFVGIFANVCILMFGLVVGSFLNVVIHRLPREGLSLTSPRRSFCPACLNQIAWYDNIPILSWVALRGHCRFCHAPISARYPLVELLAGLLSLFIFQSEGLGLRYFFYFYFVMCLTAIAFIDLELMIIPDLLVKPTFLVGLISAVVTPYPPLAGKALWRYLAEIGWNDRLISLAGATLGFVIGFLALYAVAMSYKLLRGHRGLGEGDPPLMGLIALFLGLPSILPVLLLSSMIALVSVAILVLTGRFQSQGLAMKPIPFGPFLSLAALIWLFQGQAFLTWYFSLMNP